MTFRATQHAGAPDAESAGSDSAEQEDPPDPVAEEGARLLAASLHGGTCDVGQLRQWLLGEAFPCHVLRDPPYEAIVDGIRALPLAADLSALTPREAIGAGLAEIIADKPEQKGSVRERGDLLYNLYELARIVQVPDILAAPLAQAVADKDREIPDDLLHAEFEHGRVPQYLLNAAIANQIDQKLRQTWADLLKHGDEADRLRDRWDAQWGHGWDGIRDMPDSLDAGVPSLDAIGQVQNDVLIWIEKEVRAAGPNETADGTRERLVLYHDLLDDLCATWGALKRADVTALTVTHEGPFWALLALFTGLDTHGTLTVIHDVHGEMVESEKKFLMRFRAWFARAKREKIVPGEQTVFDVCIEVIANAVTNARRNSRPLSEWMLLIKHRLMFKLGSLKTGNGRIINQGEINYIFGSGEANIRPPAALVRLIQG